ncbi:hypothetical protein N0V82_006341 [Gnomoniopsis sp. IMI 355080]|nr:hypothetical protein N0V82_006341 [Gnomoniopsis sp. IMI 355080]
MQANSANDFLPAVVGSRPYGDNGGEDDFDVARFSAIRKEQKEELERLDHHYSSSQAAIDTQLYTNLTKTVGITIENQVQLRLQQDRLRQEHETKKSEVEARYHNEASKLITSTTSHAGRHPKPPLLPSQGLVPSQGPIPHSASRPPIHTVGPISHALNLLEELKTPPNQPRIPQRALTSDDMTRERVVQQPPRKEYLVPLPTPMPTPEDLMPHQRRLVPAEPRRAEPRSIEPRPIETQSVETRTKPRVDTPPVEPYTESRQVEQRYLESRSAEQDHVRQHVDRSLGEQLTIEQRQNEPRSVKHSHNEHHIEQDPAELRRTGQRGEHRSVEQVPTDRQTIEQRQPEPRQIEPRPAQPIVARLVHEGSMHMEQQPPAATSVDKASELVAQSSATTPSRQEGKRKAAETPVSEQATVVPSSKRPRTRERPTGEDLETQATMNRSPRSTRRSSGAPAGTAKESRVKTIQRTIPFHEVYQDGKAQFKHKIFPWPKDSDNWYIVRCDEHQVHFNNGNPIHGAAKHVHSPQHGHLEKRHDLAMEICGHLVLDCNAELAELNNREFERALKEDNYQVFNKNLLTKEGRRRLTDGPAHNVDAVSSSSNIITVAKNNPKSPSKTGSVVTRPEECKFYLGFWAPTKKWYMLIVLPIRPDGSLREVGLREKLQQTDLLSNVPKCYRSDRISLRIIGWQPAYSDGGAKADKREYPVMFFDSPVQKHSVGWLPGAKLRPVDLYNPPDDADKKGLAMARDWYAMRMMHRKDWEQLKRLGPGEPPSPTSSEGDSGKTDQWTSLRSAHNDDMSPIRGKSNGPGLFFGSGSSEEGSDIDETEDPMTMDIGPIPEPADSNYVEEDSGSDESNVDVEMKDTVPDNAAENDTTNVIHPDRRKSLSRCGSQPSNRGQETSLDDARNEETTAASRIHSVTTTSATPPAEGPYQARTIAMPEQDHYLQSAQAKAMAAVKEAASRSRASSEIPEMLARSSTSTIQQHPARAPVVEAGVQFSTRPDLMSHSHSRSEDILTHFTSSGRGEVNEARYTSELRSTANKGQEGAQAVTRAETHIDQYKRYEAIRAQMNGLSSRPASVPVNMGSVTSSSFDPPPQPVQTREPANNMAQQAPNGSHTMSPPLSQSSVMVPARSSSTTPTHGVDSGRSTPKIVVPEDTSRWKIVHNGSSDPVQQSHTSVTNKSSSPTTTKSLQASVQPLVQPTPQLGTPIHDKQETFDVSQFHGPESISWAREGPNKPFLRLITDPMRKWAETARESSLKASIEPAQVQWIETDHPEGDRDKQRVRLMTKDDHEVVLIFETNSANGRSQKAALQGRKFVSWVKRMNEKVEWRDE